MAKETKVQAFDRRIGRHRDAGSSVVAATVKAVKEIVREKGGKS